jgi:translation initiation factor 1
MPDENSKLVYSTDKMIQRKEKPVKKAFQASLQPARQQVTVRLERKGRGGKSVTVIKGVQMPQGEKESFLKNLKTRLGTGGTVKDDSIEIQGDHREILIMELVKIGYPPK